MKQQLRNMFRLCWAGGVLDSSFEFCLDDTVRVECTMLTYGTTPSHNTVALVLLTGRLYVGYSISSFLRLNFGERTKRRVPDSPFEWLLLRHAANRETNAHIGPS